VATFEEIPDVELANVIDLAQAGYERDWRNRPIAQRAQVVRAASKLMRARQEHLAAAFGVTARRLRRHRRRVGAALLVLVGGRLAAPRARHRHRPMGVWD